MFEGFAGGGIDDGVITVEDNCGGCDLGSKAGGVVRDDNVLLVGVVLNMVGLLCGEAMVAPAAMVAAVGGSSFGPGDTLDTGVDCDASLEERHAVSGVFLGIGGAPSAHHTLWWGK
jgi:hypothetical protein